MFRRNGFKSGILFEADNGAGNGGGQDGGTGGATGKTSDDQGKKEGTGQGGSDNSGKTVTLTEAELQSKIDAAIQERLKREKDKSARDQAKAKEDAENKRLEESKAWEELAGKQKARITELEAAVAKVDEANTLADRYKKALEARLKSDRDGLPAAVVTLLDKLDPVEQMEWIAKNAAELKGTAGQGGAGKQGSGPGAGPKQGSTKTLTEEQQKAAAQAQANYTASMF